jgi:CRP/FNR family transcriptional regulator
LVVVLHDLILRPEISMTFYQSGLGQVSALSPDRLGTLQTAVTPAPCGTCASRQFGLRDAVPGADLHQLVDTAHWLSISKGGLLMTEGHPSRHFFSVNHGYAKLYKDLSDGRRQVIGFVTGGQFIGLGAQAYYSFTAEALDEVNVCRFERSRFDDLLAQFPALEQKMLAAACNDLALAQAQMLSLGRKTALERLASFLLEWYDRSMVEGAAVPMLPMGRRDIADYLGLTIETVSRCLTVLRKRRLIKIVADYDVVIIHHAALRTIGAGE